jgi:DNA (cytosine-5)-methyltransferase 1
MRTKLLRWGGAWIMENVEDAPLLNGVTLCGHTLGLPVYRHRKFEAPFMMLAPAHRRHTVVIGHGRMVNDRRGTLNAGSAAGAWGKQTIFTVAGGQFKKADGERALGIDWMSVAEISQAIPPAFSRYLAQFIPLPAERVA